MKVAIIVFLTFVCCFTVNCQKGISEICEQCQMMHIMNPIGLSVAGETPYTMCLKNVCTPDDLDLFGPRPKRTSKFHHNPVHDCEMKCEANFIGLKKWFVEQSISVTLNSLCNDIASPELKETCSLLFKTISQKLVDKKPEEACKELAIDCKKHAVVNKLFRNSRNHGYPM